MKQSITLSYERTAALTSFKCKALRSLALPTDCSQKLGTDVSPNAKDGMYLVYLKYWTLNLMRPMVYPKVLFYLKFSINGCEGLTLAARLSDGSAAVLEASVPSPEARWDCGGVSSSSTFSVYSIGGGQEKSRQRCTTSNE